MITTHIKRADKFSRWRNSSLAICSVFGSSNQGKWKRFSGFSKQNVMIKCRVKCQSQTKPKTKQRADDKLKEILLKET